MLDLPSNNSMSSGQVIEYSNFSYLVNATAACFGGAGPEAVMIPVLEKMTNLKYFSGSDTFLGLPQLQELNILQASVVLPPMPELIKLVVTEATSPLRLARTPKLQDLEIYGSHVIFSELPQLHRLVISVSAPYEASLSHGTSKAELPAFPELKELICGRVSGLATLPWYPKLNKLVLNYPMMTNGRPVFTLEQYRHAWSTDS